MRLTAEADQDMVSRRAPEGGELWGNRMVGCMESQAEFADAVGSRALVAALMLDAVLKARLLCEQHQRGQGMQQPDARTRGAASCHP